MKTSQGLLNGLLKKYNGNWDELCDDYTNERYSFGFSVTTEDIANEFGKTRYCACMLIKVKVRYEDVARVVYDEDYEFYKVRCCRMEILS